MGDFWSGGSCSGSGGVSTPTAPSFFTTSLETEPGDGARPVPAATWSRCVVTGTNVTVNDLTRDFSEVVLGALLSNRRSGSAPSSGVLIARSPISHSRFRQGAADAHLATLAGAGPAGPSELPAR